MSLRWIAHIGVENCTYSFDSLFSYIIPEELLPAVMPGIRVLVPFGRGNRSRQGFVFDVKKENEQSENGIKLKKIISVLDSGELLSDELIKLAAWIKERYFCTYFTAAKALLPGGMCLRTEKTYALASDIPPEKLTSLSGDERLVVDYLSKKKDFCRESLILKNIASDKNSPILKILTKKGVLVEAADAFSQVRDLSLQLIRLSDAYLAGDNPELTKKQKCVVDVLTDIGAATIKEICYFSGVNESVPKLLIKKGVCDVFSTPLTRARSSKNDNVQYVKPVLSEDQQRAFNSLKKAYFEKKYNSALLYGITGSGKTSVYLELIDTVLADGKNVIVLVPEISLTPQTFSLFSSKYGKDIAILHSALSMGEKYDEWKKIKNGKARVVIGTRSAVFAPLDNIGLIIIDEEQEHTYKSEMSPRYNAKDVARFRCAYSSAFLLFASATPSIETYAKAKGGQMLLCELNNRFGNAVLPEVHTVDMTDRTLLNSFFAISTPLASEIEKNLRSGEQSILLVNRRGYNTFVVCSDCKKVVTCPHCSISMTYHAANNRLMCHYCGYSIPFIEKCPSCGADNIKYSGFGTQRVEQELQMRFPEARILRMDADTTVAKDSHEKALSAFANGEYDILIGTQMVAKGLDFPNVTLVGITSADKELYNSDFRSSERTFDLITQVVGRAGRGNKNGRAIIQTVSPDNEIISVASEQNYKAFFSSEIKLRKAMVYPPFCDIYVIGFSGSNQENVVRCAITFFENIKKLNEKEYKDLKIIVLGPMSPRVSKVNNLYRQHILIKCVNSSRMRDFINILLKKIYDDRAFKDIALYADINPLNLD